MGGARPQMEDVERSTLAPAPFDFHQIGIVFAETPTRAPV